jgi:glycosyltransferase involved in cell wall biosynthesis
MVGRNEENRFLVPVLERLQQQVDEIVFTDDCSEDNTLEIAQKYCHAYKTLEPTFAVHEGRLRTNAWSNLSKHAKEGDWILAIDCDEMLYNQKDLSSTDIKSVLRTFGNDAVNIRFYHMWNEKQYRVDKLWAPNNSSRLFRYMNNGEFNDKALACGSEPTYVHNWINQRNYQVNSNLIMQHLGYLKNEDKQAKYKRYLQLDGGKYHNLNHINSILDSSPVLMQWDNVGV